jgi:REP element-mobilizing transposase RayT
MTEYRRDLPHLHQVDRVIFVTWRLAGSLPTDRPYPGGMIDGRRFVAMDRVLDAAQRGPLYLKQPEIARVVAEAILNSRGDWEPEAFVVMPNHVHLLVAPRIETREMMRRIKGASARYANQLLGLSGQAFWQHESYDHLVRNIDEFARIKRYIELNPVRAGLVSEAAEFEFLRS